MNNKLSGSSKRLVLFLSCRQKNRKNILQVGVFETPNGISVAVFENISYKDV